MNMGMAALEHAEKMLRTSERNSMSKEKQATTDRRPTYTERLDRLIKPMTKTAEGLSEDQWSDYSAIRTILHHLDEADKRVATIYDLMPHDEGSPYGSPGDLY